MKGHIVKRGARSWGLVVSLGKGADGKYGQKWYTVKGSKADAQRELRTILKQLDEGAYVSPHRQTVEDFLHDWLAFVEQHIDSRTFIGYEDICTRHLIPGLGHIELMKLSPQQIDRFYADSLRSGRLDGKGGLSLRTVLHHHRVLSQALQRAVTWRLLTRNPAHAAEPPKPPKKEFRTLDGKQTAELLEAAGGLYLYPPVMLAVTTGLRRGEVLGLKWSDIDLDKDEPALQVRRSVGQVKGKVSIKPPKTKKSRRTVILLNVTVRELKKHRLSQKKARLQIGPGYNADNWVFPTPFGELWKPDTLTATFRRFINKNELGPLRFQDLRHTHATLLLSDGVFAKVVSERLGHASVGITLDTYAHVLPGMQAEAAQRLDSIMEKALGQLGK